MWHDCVRSYGLEISVSPSTIGVIFDLINSDNRYLPTPVIPSAFANNLSRTVVTHVRSGANSRSMLPPSYRLLSANRREAGMDSEGKKTRLTRGGQPPAVRRKRPSAAATQRVARANFCHIIH